MTKSDILNKLEEMFEKSNELIGKETSIRKDIGSMLSSDSDEKHESALNLLSLTVPSFEYADVVDCDSSLINQDMLENMWKNIDVYSWDMEEGFFLNKCVMHLRLPIGLTYNIYFSIEEEGIFIFSNDNFGNNVAGGVIQIEKGKFGIRSAYLSDQYRDIFVKNHIEEGLPTDRENIAYRTLMNLLLHLIIVNELVNKNKEVITETSKRVELPTKKKHKKKNQSKKTTVIKYIKVDEVKVRRIRADFERQQREKYERHTSEWTRRGHYKTLRNGEVKWIKPTTCHAQDKVGEKIQKIYKIQ